MQLKNGIRVYVNKENASERFFPEIELSSGLGFLANSFPTLKEYYKEHAIVPKQPWIKVSNDASDLLLSTQQVANRNQSIGLFRLPTDIIDWIKKLQINTFKNLDELTQKRKENKEEFEEFNDALTTYIYKYCHGGHEKLINLGMYFLRSNTPTATVSDSDGKTMGLHFDNSSFTSAEEVENSLNRIAINMGNHSRYFLFVNLPYSTFKNWIHGKGYLQTDEFTNKAQVAKAFTELYPDYPIIKIELKPFEGYIAPVSNILHDACLHKNATDICLHILGAFSTFQHK